MRLSEVSQVLFCDNRNILRRTFDPGGRAQKTPPKRGHGLTRYKFTTDAPPSRFCNTPNAGNEDRHSDISKPLTF